MSADVNLDAAFEEAETPGPGTSGAGWTAPDGGGGTSSWRSRLSVALGLAPFAIYALLFLGLPMVAVLSGAFEKPTGGFTFSNIHTAVTGVYLHGFEQSIEMGLLTASVGGVCGLFIANAVHTSRGTRLKRLVSTASGVCANFGGVPLAFLFIASVGSAGIVTSALNRIGINILNLGFNLYTFFGVALVYMYFQIPIMVLVVTPALDGLRPAWREASDNLGARGWQYWRYVGGPVLLPSVLSSMLLLFGSALSAYATAEALTSGSIALTSIQIGSFLNGNVIAGQQNVGKALGLGLVVVIGVAMVFYALLQRRASKWLR